MASISSSPCIAEDIFKDYSGRHGGIVRALIHGNSICNPNPSFNPQKTSDFHLLVSNHIFSFIFLKCRRILWHL